MRLYGVPSRWIPTLHLEDKCIDIFTATRLNDIVEQLGWYCGSERRDWVATHLEGWRYYSGARERNEQEWPNERQPDKKGVGPGVEGQVQYEVVCRTLSLLCLASSEPSIHDQTVTTRST